MTLREGHGGIFEVSIDDHLLYTNLSQCGRTPRKPEIFRLIRDHRGAGS